MPLNAQCYKIDILVFVWNILKSLQKCPVNIRIYFQAYQYEYPAITI